LNEQKQHRKQTQIQRNEQRILNEKEISPNLNGFSLPKVTAFNEKDETTINDQQKSRKQTQISKMCKKLRNEQQTLVGKEFLPKPNGLFLGKATARNEKYHKILNE
jgi:hypothetical protein